MTGMNLDICRCGIRDCVGGPEHDRLLDEIHIVHTADASKLRVLAAHGKTVSIRERARREIQRRTDAANRKGSE